MVVYKVVELDREKGYCLSWVGTKKEALALVNAPKEETVESRTWERVDIPSNKRRLLYWLNVNVDSDNG